jgi:hypothetical protein
MKGVGEVGGPGVVRDHDACPRHECDERREVCLPTEVQRAGSFLAHPTRELSLPYAPRYRDGVTPAGQALTHPSEAFLRPALLRDGGPGMHEGQRSAPQMRGEQRPGSLVVLGAYT